MSNATRQKLRQWQEQRRAVEELIEKQEYAAARDLLLARPARTNEESKLLARCHFSTGEYAKAADLASQIACETWQDHHQFGLYCNCARRWPQAEAALRKALRLGSTFGWTKLLLAESLLNGSNKIKPDHLESRSLLIECCREPASLPDAYGMADRLLDWSTDSSLIVELLQDGTRKHPNDDAIRLALTRRLVSTGEFSSAEETLTPMLMNENTCPTTQWLAFRIDAGLHRHEQSLVWIDKLFVAAKGQSNSGLHQLRGDVLFALGRFGDATASYNREAQSRDAIDTTLPFVGMAAAALKRGNHEVAADRLRRLVERWCSDGCSVGGYVMPAVESHRFDTIGHLQECLAALPSNPHLSELADHIQYLLDRRDKPISLKQLHKLAKSLNHWIIDYDYSVTYAQRGRFQEAVEHHLKFAWAVHQADQHWQAAQHERFYQRLSTSAVLPAENIHATIVRFISAEEARRSEAFITAFVLPLYYGFWRSLLVKSRLGNELHETCGFLSNFSGNLNSFQFDTAFALDLMGRQSDAIEAYRQLLICDDKLSGAWNNLSILLENENVDEAIACAGRAFDLAPDNERYQKRWIDIQTLKERKAAEKAKNAEELRRVDAFQRTAVDRFPDINQYERRILAAIATFPAFQSLKELAQLSGTSEQYINRSFQKLVDGAMVIDGPDNQYRVNPWILPFVEKERTHSLATKIIHADKTIAYKAIFNSRMEYAIYKVMIGLFPNHLVFPNMSLQSVFQYERILPLVDRETFGYYLKAHVDLCVVSTANYLPLIGFEIDSRYHDGEKQQVRDGRKNDLFRLGGVPLVRVRAYGEPTEAVLRERIIEDIHSLGEVLRRAPPVGLLNLAAEIDFDHFGGI
jgi:tetratricopeptide (TPR) repeat protein